VDWIFGEVGGVAAEECSFRVESTAGKNPAGVRPPRSIVRSVRVAFMVRVLMMDAVSGYPEDRTTFKRHCAAHGDEVFDPTWRLVAAVREQAMVGHADAYVDREEVGDGESSQVFPGKKEESRDRSDVKKPHCDGGNPVDSALLVLAPHAEVLLNFLGDFGDDGNDGRKLWRGFDWGFFNRAEGTHDFSFSFTLLVLVLKLAGAEGAGCKTFVMPPEGVSW